MLASQEQFPWHKSTPLTLKEELSYCTEGVEDDAWKLTSDRSEHKAVKCWVISWCSRVSLYPAAFMQPDRKACSTALVKLV